ncbi:MAG: tetratricopeptide repeat protein [Salinivirgaceae bacterium]
MNVKAILILLLIFTASRGFSQSEQRSQVYDLLGQLSNAKEDTVKVKVLNELSEAFLSEELEKSLEYARSAARLSEKILFVKGLSDSYYNLGKCFYYQYAFDSIAHYYEKSRRVNQMFPENSSKFEVLMGLVSHIQADYSKAIKHYTESLQLLKQLDNKKDMAYCYNNIGAAFYNLYNYEKALENYYLSMALNEELGYLDMVATIYANIGGIYEDQKKFDRAMESYKKANSLATEIDAKSIIADTYRNLGGIYDERKQFDSAMMVYQSALDIYLEQNDLRGVIGIYNLFGQTYLRKSDYVPQNEREALFDKSIEYYNRSLRINLRELSEIEEQIVSYQGLGEVSLNRKNYPKAISYLLKAKTMAEEIESLVNLKSTNEQLSKAYAAVGDYKKAYQSFLRFKEINDTIQSDENVELLTQMSMQYEFDKQQKEQEFIQAQKDLEYQQKQKRDRLVRTFILIGLLVVSGFSVQVFRSYKRKMRDNLLLEEQKAEIEKQKEEITDSIKYAKRIQTAILPAPGFATEILREHFILFRPRDIVSGDYYWMNKVGNKVIVAAADCTGHGVPGAFMSMLGVSFLNEIVNKNNTVQPHLILNDLRSQVKRTLGQTGKEGEAKDGMDIALCVIDFEANKLQYAGAYNPLLLFRNGELIEVKADKMPIGIYIREKESFTNNEIELQPGDTFYIFSDGYADQFGGPTGGKFKSKPFKELLLSIQDKSMAEQREILNTTIDEWRGEIDQIDDIIVMGVRV